MLMQLVFEAKGKEYMFMCEEEEISMVLELFTAKFGLLVIKKKVYTDVFEKNILSEKQEKVLLEAHNMDYYEVPRTITQKSVGKKVGLSHSTVGEHLRKAEKALVDRYVQWRQESLE